MHHSYIRTLLINSDREQYMEMLQLLDAVSDVEYEMTWCRDYGLALEAMLASVHDVILLDFENEPELCHKLLRTAKAQDCQTPIVCLTPIIDEELDRQAIKVGAADYLSKSGLDSNELDRTLRYAIDRKQGESELARLAHYDQLTGIPNRLLFQDRLDRALQRSSRGDLPFALMYIDLDGFKQINDTYGHDCGDILIKTIASRLNDCLRRSDSVARLGGDEFSVLLEKVSNISDVVSIAQKIIDLVTEPCDVGVAHVRVGCSIGIAQYPEAGKDPVTLLRHADMAMYEAKAIPGSNYRFYTERMNLQVLDQSRLESQLRTAISNEHLLIHYQPRVSLRTGKVVAAEALLRWQHPDGQILSPGDFLDAAELAGLLPALGYWTINRVCQDLNSMKEAGVPPIKLSLNVSATQLEHEEFLQNVSAITSANNSNPQLLEFEIGESTLLSCAEENLELFRSLHKMGIGFSVDDFGSAASSLSLLQQLPISRLMIDSKIIQDISSESSSQQLVKAIVSLAHSMDFQVVAEAVETEQQKTLVQEAGVDQLQGFLYSPPRPYSDFVDFIQQKGVTSRRSYLSVVDDK
jgi:diguanylate cyclase (GGDEF)-like protein